MPNFWPRPGTLAEMETVRVSLGDRSYDISVSDDLFVSGASVELLAPFVKGVKVLIVSDSNVFPLYGELLQRTLLVAGASGVAQSVFPAGETSKHLATIGGICRDAARAGLDRGSLVVGLGGGVVGDMAAFAASIYMRGIRCVQVPTSLLAMIDSGVGGKTGVDLPEGKNLVGTFYQPKAVLMDTLFLTSLPVREMANGFAELIKHAVLFDCALFDELMAAGDTPFRDHARLAPLVARSCALKAAVVSRDEQERGERMLLNLGHTFGHAIEKVQDYRGLEHGEAVAVGVAAAAHLSVRLGLLDAESAEKIVVLLRQYHLPVTVPGCDPAALMAAMAADKKAVSGVPRIVLPLAIGRAEVRKDVPREAIEAAWETVCERS